MKVFFLITGLGVGGAEQQVVTLADQLAALGHQIMLCYITGQADILPQQKSVNVISLNANKTPYSLIMALFSLTKIIKQFNPDIIHSHMIHANLMARIVKLIMNYKGILICTAHNKNEGGKLRMLAYRLTDSLADISTNVSQEAVDTFIAKKAVKSGRMLVFYNGIDVNKFKFDIDQRKRLREDFKIADHTKIFIAIGRLAEAKDYPNLLYAYANLAESDTVLWIVGKEKSHYGKILQQLAKNLHIEHKVFFLGMRSDIPELLSAADIFVLSSAWEGLPLVIAEAMACEKVIVATDSGGVKEMLADCGYLVPIKQPKLLALSMSKAQLLSDNEILELTKRARQRVVMHYNIEQISEQWLVLYQHLLDSKNS